MEQFKEKTINRLKALIAKSAEEFAEVPFNGFHTDLVKRCYNAVEVHWDYANKKIAMHVIVDDDAYDPSTINMNMETLPVVVSYLDLRSYLESCILKDNRSVLHYLKLLFQYGGKTIKEKDASPEMPMYVSTLLY